MLTILSAAATEAMTLGEKASMGGITMLVGLGTVFLGLVILIAAIKILTALVGEKKKAQAPAAAPNPAPTPVPVAAAPAAQEDEDELIAVLTAAVAMMTESTGGKYRITSFRRVGSNAPAWNRAGRQSMISSRF
jgi:sodium pump decarboxylase gamma subunit